MPTIQEKLAELTKTLYAVHVAEAELFELPTMSLKDWMDSGFVPEGDKRIQCYSNNVLQAVCKDAEESLAAINDFKKDLAVRNDLFDILTKTIVEGILKANEKPVGKDEDYATEKPKKAKTPNFDFMGIRDPLGDRLKAVRPKSAKERNAAPEEDSVVKDAIPLADKEAKMEELRKLVQAAARKVFGDGVTVKATLA